MRLTWTRRVGAERGVALVEMAVVTPLLLLLSLGVIDAAWAVSQHNAVRAETRNAARIAATQNVPLSRIGELICPGLGMPDAKITTSQIDAATSDPPGSRGALAALEISAPNSSLTGFFGIFDGISITATIEFRVEYAGSPAPAWWSEGTITC